MENEAKKEYLPNVTKTSNKFLRTLGKIFREDAEKKNKEIIREAEKAFDLANRKSICEMIGAEYKQNSDDEGGGSISIIFPENLGWDSEKATDFAFHTLNLDLGNSYGGPGQFFKDGNYSGTQDKNPSIFLRWGLDI